MDGSYRGRWSWATEELAVDARDLERDPVEALARFGATMILSRYIEAEVSQSLNEIFYAPCLEEALAAARRLAGRWGNVYPEATTLLGKDLSDGLSFFRFPPRHGRRLRTSNILERCLGEVRRRTRVIGRFPTEMSALSLIWSVMDEDSKTWHGMIMDAAHQSLALAAVESLRTEPIVVKGFEELLAA